MIAVARVDRIPGGLPEPLEIIPTVDLTGIAVFLKTADVSIDGGMMAAVSDSPGAGQVGQFGIILRMPGQPEEELIGLRPMEIAQWLQNLVHALDVLLPALAQVQTRRVLEHTAAGLVKSVPRFVIQAVERLQQEAERLEAQRVLTFFPQALGVGLKPHRHDVFRREIAAETVVQMERARRRLPPQGG